jgi:hypothetical protein
MAIDIVTKLLLPELPRFEEPPPEWRPCEGLNWMGFSAMCLSKAVAVITQSPDAPFKPQRLCVDPLTASRFTLYDIRIGIMSYTFGGDGVLCTLFPPIPRDLSLEERRDYEQLLAIKLGTCSPAQKIGLYVRNISNEPAEFNAILWGGLA